MGAAKILFMDLMRIITPEEINELTTKHEGEIRYTLTEALLAGIEGREFVMETGRAKKSESNILKFPEKEGVENENLGHEKLAEEAVESIEQQSVECEVEKENTSSFILAEKRRFEKNQKILKSKEVMDMYSKNASVNIRANRGSSDDLRKSSEVGILIDKKHF